MARVHQTLQQKAGKQLQQGVGVHSNKKSGNASNKRK